MSCRRSFSTAVSVLFLVTGLASGSAGMEPLDPARYERPIRVACVGDSITYGMGTQPGMSYPSQLQALLGAGYEVGNFGVSARTLLRKGDFPWWNEPAFQLAQDFQPDAVIIMLGTNDTKPHNWAHKDEFYTDYRDLADVFAQLPGKPKIYVCRPCPVPEPGNWGINETNIQHEIEMIDRLAEEMGLGMIDMHAALVDQPELLPDRVHPNTEGALLMAKAAFRVLTGKPVPPRVNSYFADHMVLQRGMKIPVWGPGLDGESITVEFAGQNASSVAKDGKWTVILEPLKACAEPQTMTISSDGGGARSIHDVLVGDVWVASGQSNMERQLGPRGGQKDIVGWEEAAASADYPLIRQYQIPRNTSPMPLDDGHGSWLICTPETAADFCGVGYFFIRDVYEAQQIPMALIHTTWGGTPAEAWTSLEQVKAVPSYAGLAETVEKLTADPSILADMRQAWFEEHDAGSAGQWWAEETTAGGWSEVEMPAFFEAMGLQNFDGVVWFRKEFEVSDHAAGKPATLVLGQIDDNDRTWVNGEVVGETDGWTRKRNYSIPAGLLKPGRNVIAVRVLDTGSQGGWASGPDEMHLFFGEETETVSLSGVWQEQVGAQLTRGAEFYVRGRLNQNSPSMLFNAMIHPLLPQPIKGVIWYQGESNNDRADDYEGLFAAMIEDWRARWNCGEFPFLYVQIAPYKGMTPELRESQRKVLAREPNTAMVVTTDVGDAEDIHPADKGPVGERLALAARALAYGEDIVYSGPLYDCMAVEGPYAVIGFTHVGSGLMVSNGDLKGFEVAGADGMFVPATAEIDGDTVVVSSEQVKAPTAVRYGWSNVPDVNLFNKEGLPASPFMASLR